MMAVGKNRADWWRTSSMLAMLVNVNRDSKRGRPVEPREMMPPGLVDKRTKKSKPDAYVSIEQLEKMFKQ